MFLKSAELSALKKLSWAHFFFTGNNVAENITGNKMNNMVLLGKKIFKPATQTTRIGRVIYNRRNWLLFQSLESTRRMLSLCEEVSLSFSSLIPPYLRIDPLILSRSSSRSRVGASTTPFSLSKSRVAALLWTRPTFRSPFDSSDSSNPESSPPSVS